MLVRYAVIGLLALGVLLALIDTGFDLSNLGQPGVLTRVAGVLAVIGLALHYWERRSRDASPNG